MGVNSSRIGKAGEEALHYQLNILFRNVEKIFTGWIIVEFIDRSKGIAVVAPGYKVQGDYRALDADGRSVLVEVKTYAGSRLNYSVLTRKRGRNGAALTQAEELETHYSAGGRSLLAWNSAEGIFIIDWPIDGFSPGSSLSSDRAKELSIV